MGGAGAPKWDNCYSNRELEAMGAHAKRDYAYKTKSLMNLFMLPPSEEPMTQAPTLPPLTKLWRAN